MQVVSKAKIYLESGDDKLRPNRMSARTYYPLSFGSANGRINLNLGESLHKDERSDLIIVKMLLPADRNNHGRDSERNRSAITVMAAGRPESANPKMARMLKSPDFCLRPGEL